uniref:Uncharacterized protein n=1 Tax=Opuntia streptacantha TaxID=393608 RepID=A0A7C9DJL3_OPUST
MMQLARSNELQYHEACALPSRLALSMSQCSKFRNNLTCSLFIGERLRPPAICIHARNAPVTSFRSIHSSPSNSVHGITSQAMDIDIHSMLTLSRKNKITRKQRSNRYMSH